MRQWIRWVGFVLICAVCQLQAGNYDRWENGPPKHDRFFPIAVWFQDIRWAQEYSDAGINTYVQLDGLWRVSGDKEAGLQYLKDAGVFFMGEPHDNEAGDWIDFIDDPQIIGWIQQDEPDNAQPNGSGGYGPPVTPDEIRLRYQAIVAADSTRPVYLNFGRGVAYDAWVGRGVRTNHPEDYADYLNGGTDVCAFDIYPANSTDGAAGQLWRVAYGTWRLAQWSAPDQPVWCCIETTQIRSGSGRKPTPTEVRAEVWMAIIHGATGINYFAHQISPFNADAMREDTAMMAAITQINREVTNLAPAIYRESLEDLVSLSSLIPDTAFDDASVPAEMERVAFVVKEYEGYYYLFSVGMRDRVMQATFDFAGFTGVQTVDVIGENRTVEIIDGQLTDTFDRYEAHLYRIRNPNAKPNFRVMEYTLEGAGCELRWNVDPNQSYEVQWSTDLLDWTSLPGVLNADTSDLTLSETVNLGDFPSDGSWFLRVKRD